MSTPNESAEGRDRTIRAIRAIRAQPGQRLVASLTRPVIAGRRAWTRMRLAWRPSTPRSAMHWNLLKRIDATDCNAAGPPSFSNIESQACSAAQILDPGYAEWAHRLGEEPRFHRKQWEYVTILEAIRQAGKLEEGRTAVGFGVGTEPIPAILASCGLKVLATDQSRAKAGHWAIRGEHAVDARALIKPGILNAAETLKRVTHRTVDMNMIPDDLGSHDVVWSACALEHLGSPAAGIDFVRRSLDLLRPGGVAVHSTEYDLTPGPTPVDYGHCALYRKVDLEQLQSEVSSLGFEMTLNPYVALEHPADRRIAPPLSVGAEEFHLKLALYGSITTSVVLVIRRPLERE